MTIADAKSRKTTPPPASPQDGLSERPHSVEEVIQTSFRLPRSRWARLQQLSIDERLSVQSIIISALEKEFESRGRKF